MSLTTKHSKKQKYFIPHVARASKIKMDQSFTQVDAGFEFRMGRTTNNFNKSLSSREPQYKLNGKIPYSQNLMEEFDNLSKFHA